MERELGGRDWSRPLFRLGHVVATPGALEVRTRNRLDFTDLLRRHQRGDFGELDEEDRQANLEAVREGERILSSYGEGDDRLWVLTEWDRSVTTILTPGEY